MDITSFLERQRLRDKNPEASPPHEDEDAIDQSLAHLTIGRQPADVSKKGRMRQIDWDESLEEMSREKDAAEASRGKFQRLGIALR